MTDQQHPITPPPEMLQQWTTEYWGNPGERIGEGEKYIAIQAARWGADQELEACREEILDGPGRLYIGDCTLRIRLADDIWTARRPRPKSRKQRALDALTQIEDQRLSAELAAEIRNALEELPDD